MATSVQDKAAQLLSDGQVTITARDLDGKVKRARVGAYDVVRRGSGWTCDCPAGWYHQTCSHVLAAEMAAQR